MVLMKWLLHIAHLKGFSGTLSHWNLTPRELSTLASEMRELMLKEIKWSAWVLQYSYTTVTQVTSAELLFLLAKACCIINCLEQNRLSFFNSKSKQFIIIILSLTQLLHAYYHKSAFLCNSLSSLLDWVVIDSCLNVSSPCPARVWWHSDLAKLNSKRCSFIHFRKNNIFSEHVVLFLKKIWCLVLFCFVLFF